jgi:hypothetical protein
MIFVAQGRILTVPPDQTFSLSPSEGERLGRGVHLLVFGGTAMMRPSLKCRLPGHGNSAKQHEPGGLPSNQKTETENPQCRDLTTAAQDQTN